MNNATEFPSAASEPKKRNILVDFLIRLATEKPLGTFGGIIVLIFILVAIFAEILAPYPFDEVNILDRMQEPSERYFLGTDQLGRDLLSRLIYGAQISLTVGLAATALNVLIAVLIGSISGFFGGKVDLALQRFVDAWMAFPGLLLLLTIMSLVGAGSPPDHRGPRGHWRNRKLENRPQRGDWCQRERLFSSGSGDWLLSSKNPGPPRAAQYCRSRHHHFHH